MRKNSYGRIVWAIMGGLILLPPQVSVAQTAQATSECDRLAASVFDSTKPIEITGVRYETIDFEKAIPACEAAVKTQPNNARILYQYGRALDAGKRESLAIETYKKASDLGSLLAANNVGTLLSRGYSGAKPDNKAALVWYEFAAQGGIDNAKRNAADILEKGEGLAAPNLERAAMYWRSLANAGDPEAAEKVGLAILDKKVVPLDSSEVVNHLTMAASQNRFLSASRLAHLLKDRAATAEDIQQAAKYALLAYQLAFSAPSDSEEAWLPYQWTSFRLYDGLVQKGAKNVMQMVAYNQALTDFPPKDGVKFTVPIECGTTKDKFDVYIWEWTRKYPQTDSQADWVRQVRGCTIPQETVESFRRIYSIALENKVSFPDLAKYAFDPKNEVAVKQSSPPTQRKESLAEQSSARNQSDTNITPDETLGLAAVAVGAFACWYWPDQCKELAWEAAKVGARELGKKAVQ